MPPQEAPAGATPVADGATPSQSQPTSTAAQTPATPAAPNESTPPAAGSKQATPSDATPEELSALGDPGKRALDRMKQERDTATGERDALARRVQELETATKSDQDKALDAAREEARTDERGRWVGTIRQLRVEGALRDAGCIDPSVTAAAREFGQLKVADDGTVEGLEEAVEDFKTKHGALFAAPATPARGDFGNGHRTTALPKEPESLEEAVTAAITSQGR